MDEIVLWLNSPCSLLHLPIAIPYRIHICQRNSQNFRYQNDTKIFVLTADNGLTYIHFAGEQQKTIQKIKFQHKYCFIFLKDKYFLQQKYRP